MVHACRCGLRQKSVCTYTTGLIPASETEELGNVLEIAGLGVVGHGTEGRITVAIKARNGLWNGALRRITRCRRRAVGRALGLLLGLRVTLGWTAHFGLCIVLALIEGEREIRCRRRSPLHEIATHRRDGEMRTVVLRTLISDLSQWEDWRVESVWSREIADLELRQVSKAVRKFNLHIYVIEGASIVQK